MYSLIGLRPESYPTPSEDAVLIKIIRDKYAGYTLEEIKTAFSMAINRELSDDLVIDHYQLFSAEYLGRIMSAYRIFRTEELKKINRMQTTYKTEYIETKEYFIKCLIEPYEKYLIGLNYPYSHLDGWMLYNRLHKIIGLTQDQKNEYKRAANAMTRKERTETDEQYERRYTNIGKHLAFKAWIEQKAFEDFNMREFILSKIKQK